MGNIRKFTNIEDAYSAISNALKQDNWKDYFFVNQDGEMSSFYLRKEVVEALNTIVPAGGFLSVSQSEKILHKLLSDYSADIAEWIVQGGNMPMIIQATDFTEPVGYSFDENSNEQCANKVKLILRRELRVNKEEKHKTKLGIFVSSCTPVAKF